MNGIDAELATWLRDPDLIPERLPWPGNDAVPYQVLIGWALISRKARGCRRWDTEEVASYIAGCVPNLREMRDWTRLLERITALTVGDDVLVSQEWAG